MPAVHVAPKDVASIIAATFSGYAGGKCKIVPAESVTFTDLNWSGGTRSVYRACRLDGQPLESRASMNAPAPWDNPYEGHTVEIPSGYAIVEHSQFCGKDMGLTIYARPGDVAPLLPAPQDGLPALEALVLKYTVERKSSYNGKDRYAMACDDLGQTIPSRADWESAKQALIARGYLNNAGAVTIAGRNAHKR